MTTNPTPARTLSALGYPGYSDDFAAKVLDYVVQAEAAGYVGNPDAYPCAIAYVLANGAYVPANG